MSKFCKFCGSSLEEGQTCACQSAPAPDITQQAAQPSVAPPTPPIQPPVATAPPVYQAPVAPQMPKEPSVAKMTVANIFPFLKAYISAPDATTKAAVVQNDIGLATAFSVVIGLSVFAFIYSFFMRFTFIAKGLIASITKRLPFFDGLPIDSSTLRGVKISLPFFQSFIYCMIFSAIIVLLTTLIMFFSAKLAGTSLSFKASFISGSVSLIFPCIFILVAVLCLFVSFTFTVLALLVAVLAWCISVYSTAKSLSLQQSTGGFVVGMVAIMAISIILSSYACGKTITATAQNMEINKAPVSEIFDEFSDLLDDFSPRGFY